MKEKQKETKKKRKFAEDYISRKIDQKQKKQKYISESLKESAGSESINLILNGRLNLNS